MACAYFCGNKYCSDGGGGQCKECWKPHTCATCGKTGHGCGFVKCAFDSCTSVMCSVGVHGGWKASDQGEAPGCAMEWVPDGILNPADGGEPQWQRYHDERKFYCHDHAPAGSHPLRTL